jgi:hypothetical protein
MIAAPATVPKRVVRLGDETDRREEQREAAAEIDRVLTDAAPLAGGASGNLRAFLFLNL